MRDVKLESSETPLIINVVNMGSVGVVVECAEWCVDVVDHAVVEDMIIVENVNLIVNLVPIKRIHNFSFILVELYPDRYLTLINPLFACLSSGVKPVDKKDGAGSHNWGTHNDEIE